MKFAFDKIANPQIEIAEKSNYSKYMFLKNVSKTIMHLVCRSSVESHVSLVHRVVSHQVDPFCCFMVEFIEFYTLT